MTSILTRQLSIGTSNKAAPQGEVTLYKSWSLPFKRARDDGEAILVLLLESAEPKGSRLLGQVYEALRKAFGRESIERSTVKERMDSAIQAANELVLREMANTSASSTQRISVLLAAFMPAEDAGYAVVIAHVGACRAFLRSRQQITPLTLPHTWGQENVKNGSLKAEEEENESQYPYWRHPTRALGVAQKVAVDFTLTAGGAGAPTDCVTLARGDTMLLCSSRLTATALKKQNPRIDARSASELAQQLTEQAALPGGNGAATVMVGRSNNLALAATGAIVLTLGALVFLVLGVSLLLPPPPPPDTPTAIAQSAAGNDPSATVEPSPSPTVTPVPIESASLTPLPSPSPSAVAVAAVPARSPTATLVPTTTPITTQTPTATSTPSPASSTPTVSTIVTSTATMMPASTTDVFVAAKYPVVLMAPLPDHTVRETNRTLQFAWNPSTDLPDGYEYELVFWLDGMDPVTKGESPVGSGRAISRPVTFPVKLFGRSIFNQDICWGVRLWQVESESKVAVAMLSDGCRVLKVRTESERPADSGSSTQGGTGGTPCVTDC